MSYAFANEKVYQVIYIFDNFRVKWKASFIKVSIYQ